MNTQTLPLVSETIHESFRQWQLKQETLDAQLDDSLSALVAYQTHLDGWQQQLARERDALRAERQKLDHERNAVDECGANSAKLTTDLNEARLQLAASTNSLLSRTEELRIADRRQSELSAEVAIARAREKDLQAIIEEQRHALETERADWSVQLVAMRALLDRRDEPNSAPEIPGDASTTEQPPDWTSLPIPQKAATSFDPPPPRANKEQPTTDSPVLGSIMEQFGKLRQQRATDRQIGKNAR